MWAQVGPGKYARKDSSSGATAQPSSHNQPVMSRSEITSLIDTRVAEILSQQMSSLQNTELIQQPSSDLNTTVKEPSDEFKEFKTSIPELLKDVEDRLENLNQRCDRMEKSASDEQSSLNTSFKKLQQEFRDGSTKLTKRFEDVDENLRSMVKKEIEHQHQRDNPDQNEFQKLTRENLSKMQTTQSRAGFEATVKGGRIGTWTRETESDDEFDEAGVGLTEKPVRDRIGVQSPTDFCRMTQESHIHNAERTLESLVEYDQMQVKELGLKSNNKSDMHVNKAKHVGQSTSSEAQLKKDAKGNQLTHIPNESFSRDAERLKSLDSRLEGDLTENQFIKIPIAALSRGNAEQLMSLDSRLEDDLTENQFIKIPIAALSRGDAEQLMSLDSRLEDDLTENQFIKIPIAALSREDAEQLMSLDSRLVHF